MAMNRPRKLVEEPVNFLTALIDFIPLDSRCIACSARGQLEAGNISIHGASDNDCCKQKRAKSLPQENTERLRLFPHCLSFALPPRVLTNARTCVAFLALVSYILSWYLHLPRMFVVFFSLLMVSLVQGTHQRCGEMIEHIEVVDIG